MKFENWDPESDEFLKKGEIELHQFLHSKRKDEVLAKEKILKRKAVRWNSLRESIERIGGMRGSMLEVGAGDGWCSSVVLSEYPVEEAYIVEIDEAAVRELIPATLSSFEVEERDVTIVLGSFNKIPKSGYFDFAIAMGALHHSANLYATFKSIYDSLKPSGYLLSQEPCMVDETPNSFYDDRNESMTEFAEGIEIKNAERSDNFFRECEYRTAALHAGFDVDIRRIINAPEKPSGLKRFFSSQKHTAEEKPDPSKPYNVFITAQKPSKERTAAPVTSWESSLLK